MNAVTDCILYFFLYSVIGWICETIYCSIGDKKFVNRGFLTGPMCPIYGTGATVFSVLLFPFYEKYGYSKWYIIALVILLGMVLADIVEFITSVIMEKLFNARWWDYSDQKFNIQGRICLKHTCYWGLAAGIFVYIIHPFVTKRIEAWLTPNQRLQIVIMLLAVFAVDLFFALRGAFDLRKFMKRLDKLNDSATEAANHLKNEIKVRSEDIQDTMEKGVFRIAVWIADVTRQLSEFEAPPVRLKKNGEKKKIRSSAERLYLNTGTFRKTADEKIKSIRDIVSEIEKSAEDNDEKE